MESLDKVCEREHERIVHFGEQCPLCYAYEMLGRVIDSANDVLNRLPVKQIVKRSASTKKNLIQFPRPLHDCSAIDQPDGAA
jgi:hypothetical protein